MAHEKQNNPESPDLEAAQEDREESEREADEAEQQDLNQGMSTGTHDSTRHGVDWGRAYRKTPTPGSSVGKRPDPKDEKK